MRPSETTHPRFHSIRDTTLPLTPDALFVRTLGGDLPAFCSGFSGTLNSAGDEHATVVLAPGQASAWVGRTVWVAAVCRPPGELPSYSSAAAAVQVLP